MIDFSCKIVNLRASLPVFVILLLAACAQPVVKDEAGKKFFSRSG